MWRQTYGYLPSHKASPPIGWYQIILLGDRGIRVLTTCPGLHSTAGQPGFKPATCWLPVQHLTIRPPNHTHTITTTPCLGKNCAFLPCDAMHKCSLCCRLLSVCPSVTLVHCIKMAEDIIKLLTRTGSPIILVFDPSSGTQFQGELLQWGRKIQGVGKFCN